MEFPNFLYRMAIFRIIAKLGWGSQISQLSFTSSLLSLRLPSETLHLSRAPKDGRICDSPPPSVGKIVVGVRNCNDAPTLVMKFSFRKYLPGGCILRGFCTCDEKAASTKSVWPPRRIWPIIAEHAEPGDLLFPKYARGDFNRCLKFILTKLKFMEAQNSPSQAPRAARPKKYY